MPTEATLARAYALRSPEDNRVLYAEWAEGYDGDFADKMDYQLPFHVAQAFAVAGGTGPVLDIGAGTGLCAVGLAAQDIGPIDAVDISPEMLDIARAKGLYADAFVADLTEGLPMDKDTYAGVMSAGTFTLGHLGPECMPEALRVLRPGGLAVISVGRSHYNAAGFGPILEAFAKRMSVSQMEVPVYGPNHQGDRPGDMAMIITIKV